MNELPTEGFLHALTPLCVIDTLPWKTALEFLKEVKNMEYPNKIFRVVGRKIGGEWDSYSLLQTPENAEKVNLCDGQLALNVPTKHRDEAVYNVGDIVVVGWSPKYKHFYIVRKE